MALTPVKVFLVDDHAVVRQGTRELLNSHPGITVVGESDSGKQLAALLTQHQPDVLLLDINLPNENGLDILQTLKPQFPQLNIILFTAHTDVQYIRRSMALQADGYLSKTVNQRMLQELIFACMTPERQQPVYSDDIAKKISQIAQADATQPTLTGREQEILFQITQGQTNRAIAQELILSVKTVDSHVANLMKKLNLNNRAQLTAYAYENGLV